MPKDSEIKYHSDHQGSYMTGRDEAEMSRACNLLLEARVNNCNLISNGSNYVFLAVLSFNKQEIKAIYKPRQGEVPLWDFPSGTLYKRECAAFIVSQALEWRLIPPTVVRDGPYGIGSMQWFVETVDEPQLYSQIKDKFKLKQVALFDYLVNNADRKAGHFLEGLNGRLWLVDHGLTFNTVPKLRTVLWDFSGEAIPANLLADVKALREKLQPGKQLRETLRSLLEDTEIEALEGRIATILEKPAFVYPGPYRSVPWPWY